MSRNKTIRKSSMQILSIILAFVTLLSSCEKNEKPEQGDEYLQLNIQGNNTHQTTHGFGASDAWSCQFVGKNWPDDKKEQIADWLFSNEVDVNNNPLGIGLNIWRFNIGGGSALQGGSSGISDEWRRAESFMTLDGTYDWNKHEGQRWFLQAAKQRGVSNFIGFVNSPPIYLTKNGKAFSSSSSSYNLAEENYQTYATYLADVVENLKQNEGIEFKYVSPFNEPQWDWTDGGQEGTPAKNTEIAAATKVINETFDNKGLNTLIEIPESAQLQFMYSDHYKAGRGQQINAFFDAASENYVGNLSHVAPKFAGHSYYSTWPLSDFTEVRKQVVSELASVNPGLEFWMTEYCILEDNSEIKGNGRDLGMNAALYTARVIYTDLVLANASSWQWWLAVSPYDYKDGLVYIDNNKQNGNIYDSKTLWAFGNFSRFIKPGMKRLEVARSDFRNIEQTLEGIMATSFISEDQNKLTTVIINYAKNEIPVKINIKDISAINGLKYYLTNGTTSNNLKYMGEYTMGEVLEIPARSVVTITNVE